MQGLMRNLYNNNLMTIQGQPIVVENVILLDHNTNNIIAFESFQMKIFVLIELNFLHSVFSHSLNIHFNQLS